MDKGNTIRASRGFTVQFLVVTEVGNMPDHWIAHFRRLNRCFAPPLCDANPSHRQGSVERVCTPRELITTMLRDKDTALGSALAPRIDRVRVRVRGESLHQSHATGHQAWVTVKGGAGFASPVSLRRCPLRGERHPLSRNRNVKCLVQFKQSQEERK